MGLAQAALGGGPGGEEGLGTVVGVVGVIIRVIGVVIGGPTTQVGGTHVVSWFLVAVWPRV